LLLYVVYAKKQKGVEKRRRDFNKLIKGKGDIIMEAKPQDANSKTRKSGTKKIVFLSLVTATIFFLSFTSVYLKRSENFLFQELQFSEERTKLLEKENQSSQKIIELLEEENQFSIKKIDVLEERNQYLIKEIGVLRRENNKLKEQSTMLAEFFDLATEVEVTAYAPLCPSAITGWDYSGDPTITASGEKVVPWETAAAGRNIPFGSYVLIERIGLWRINDRGGRIGSSNVDIAVRTGKEARRFGRQHLKGIFLSEEEVKHLKTLIPLD